ncbi:MAG: 4Fe-4S dicluster domain-containing protein [Bacteroidales bacterium]|nr:4Fe-4S dicluster domain-containing protein [Bacteroidales bacterium]
MIQRVNTDLKKDLLKLGVKDWNECFHCGNCTAICPLSENELLFPRKVIRQAQMGLETSLQANVSPWMCYYCGECSDTCPRDANPGELMMSLRRYLTSIYDWTGLSRLFYTNKYMEFAAIIGLAIIVILLFAIWGPPLDPNLTSEGGVKINSFAPIKWIELGDWSMAVVVGALLISNILHMFYKVIIKPGVKIPLTTYITELWKLPTHFATQAKFRKCDAKGKFYWGAHWLMMTGYTVMFTMIVVFLPEFQVEKVNDWWHWQRLLGYYSTFGLLFGLIFVIIGRIKQNNQIFKFSHLSDWLFIIMLFLTTISGIMLHLFRVGGMPYATYYTYIAHIAILIPMICIEVPFSKWSHLAYRPFAIYFAALKKEAKELEYKTNLSPEAA